MFKLPLFRTPTTFDEDVHSTSTQPHLNQLHPRIYLLKDLVLSTENSTYQFCGIGVQYNPQQVVG